MSNYRLLPFTGDKVKEHIQKIAEFRIKIFAEYPFLYDGDYEYEKKYLEKYLTMKDAIIVLAFDEEELIGLATGYPFLYEPKALQQVLQEKGLNPKEYFCFGESVLLKKHRGKGIGNRFFDLREEYVKKLNRYPYICFYTVVRDDHHPKKPKDYYSLDPFWEKRGYQKQEELIGSLSWKEIGENKETEKSMVFWTKVS